MAQFNESICHHCEHECQIMEDKHVGGFVSECCGVGFEYLDEDGKNQTENDGLRYMGEDWNG